MKSDSVVLSHCQHHTYVSCLATTHVHAFTSLMTLHFLTDQHKDSIDDPPHLIDGHAIMVCSPYHTLSDGCFLLFACAAIIAGVDVLVEVTKTRPMKEKTTTLVVLLTAERPMTIQIILIETEALLLIMVVVTRGSLVTWGLLLRVTANPLQPHPQTLLTTSSKQTDTRWSHQGDMSSQLY